MKYQVKMYNRDGSQVFKFFVSTTSYIKALKAAEAKTWNPWTHATVKGKSVRRYDNNMKIIKDKVLWFKSYDGSSPAILAMVGTYPEFHKFHFVDERDKAFEEVTCSTSAESAKADKEQTDTTVSLGETSGSKNTLTSKKISNGSAMNATCKDLPTRSSTVKSSGKSKSKSLEELTWKTGLMPSLSKSNSKGETFAKVKKISRKEKCEYPGWNQRMDRLVGKTIVATKSTQRGFWRSGKWLFKESWLDFINVTLTVKKIKPGTRGGYGGEFVSQMSHLCGQTVRVRKHLTLAPEKTFYKMKNDVWCFDPDWLTVEEVKMSGNAKVKNIPVGTTAIGPYSTTEIFSESHSAFVGKIIAVRLCGCGCRFYYTSATSPMLYFHKSWLEPKILVSGS